MQEFDPVSYILGQNSAGPYKQSGIVAYLMGHMQNNVSTRTASGAVAHITDAIAAPFKGIVAQITPVQSGSGDPSPTNVRPISGWSAVNIYHAGVNMLYDPQWVNGYTINTSGVVTENSSYRYTDTYYPCKGGGKLTGQALSVSSSKFAFTCAFYDASKTFIERIAFVGSSAWQTNALNVGTVTAPDNACYFRVACARSTNATDITVEVGETASDYVSPAATTAVTFTVPSDPGTIYGGTLSIAEDGSVTLTKTMGYVNLGTYPWSKNSAGGDHAFRASISSRKVGLGTKAICERYEFEGNFILDGIATGPDMRLYFQRTNTNIWIKDSNFSDAATLKTSLSGVHLVYELAEPTVYTLTPITPLTALEGENNLWSDSGDISVTYLADGRASNQLAVSMLLGRSYQHDPSDPDDATAAEALTILTGGDTR